MTFPLGDPDILLEGDEEEEEEEENSGDSPTRAFAQDIPAQITDLSASYSSLQSPSSLSTSFRFTSTKPRLRRSASARAARSAHQLDGSFSRDSSSDSRCTISLPVSTPFGKKLAKLPDIHRVASCERQLNVKHTSLNRSSSLPPTAMQGRTGSKKHLAKLPHYPIPGSQNHLHVPPSPGYHRHGLQDGISNSPPTLSSSLSDADSQLRYWRDLLQASRANTPLLNLSQSDNFSSGLSSQRPFSVSWDESGHRSIRESRLQQHHSVKTPIKEEPPAWLVELKGRKHVSMDEVENLAALMNSCKTPSLLSNQRSHSQTLHPPKELPSYMKSTEASMFKRKKGSTLSLNSSFNSSQ